MKKFTNISDHSQPKQQSIENIKDTNVLLDVKKIINTSLHVSVQGPIEPFLYGSIKIEGLEELSSLLESYVQKKFQDKMQQAKIKAKAGDLKWFDNNIM
jgi:hypothetical protein